MNYPTYYIYLLHFYVQRVFILATQEAIFIKPQFSSHKKIKCLLIVTGALLWLGDQWREGGLGGAGREGELGVVIC